LPIDAMAQECDASNDATITLCRVTKISCNNAAFLRQTLKQKVLWLAFKVIFMA